MMLIPFVSELEGEALDRWRHCLAAALPDDEVVAWSTNVPVAGVEIAIVANPPRHVLAALPNLRFVQSAWAGVDSLLSDPTLPDVPIARLVDPMLAADMAEAVLGHVMALHRRNAQYRSLQERGEWKPLNQPRAAMRTVGILGMGEMGAATAGLLRKVGFEVAGWSRSGRTPLEIAMFSGEDGFAALLERSQILVNLLPLTPDTRGILDAAAFALMPSGAALVNVGRGAHVVIADLLAALDAGALSHAVLDVFSVEPLPGDDPLWQRRDVTITPHVAAPTDPASASRQIALNIARYRTGKAPLGLVSRIRGY